MPISLLPMNSDRLPTWLEHCTTQYIDELIASGRTREDAIRNATKGIGSSFPDGKPAPGHGVFDLIDDDGEAVGYLWIGPDTSEDPAAWWVWDIEIDAQRRGHGFGREAMLLGEEYALGQGARTLGLNVFGS
ncbi:MAG: GNAT family N-acetyltransferase, partial [Demequinaceae bacterium]|nr:GNAT family N-acetyltransferase [Demequinaceae bacterium]